MFYHLFYPLSKYISGFNLFQYITFRSAYAAITALVISFMLGPWVMKRLKKAQIKEKISEDVPKTHRVKEGTPTMGGILILVAVLVPTLLWAKLTNPYTLLIFFATAWLGLLGFFDDYLKTVRGYPKGLVFKYKISGQILLGLVVAVFLHLFPLSGEAATQTSVPFLKDYRIDFSWFYVPLVVLVITGASNAVNLTDGLDGLAVGLVAVAGAAFAGMCYVTGHVKFSDYLNIIYLPRSGELTVFCAALVGACLGFLWFNAHPAEVFMGDTGALALGGALGMLAILIKKELLLLIVGGIFVAEALSVMLQVGYYKWKKRRIFLMAPLHHHFELLGWPEPKVVVRFWIVAVLLALLTLSTFKIR
ncbi:MAG: phospho-N-acetylmuramoyl-pentapeptide-transferase [bacterium]